MSRFWAKEGTDSSEEGSGSGSGSDSEDAGAAAKAANASRWAELSESDSASEGERVVRSAKDKAWDAMEKLVGKIKNSMKINDWNGIQTDWDLLCKQVEKQKTLIVKEGGMGTPSLRFYVRLLATLEDFLATTLKDKEAQKKMTAQNGRALNRMKLALRKHNKVYEKEIAAYRENPEESAQEEEEEDSDEDSDSDSSDSVSSSSDSSDDDDDDDDDDDGGEDAEAKAKKEKKPSKNLDELDSDEWESEDESSSSEDEEVNTELTGRARWLKTATITVSKKDKKAGKVKEEKKKKEKTDLVGKRSGFKFDENMTVEALDRKVLEVVSARGRKGTDSKELMQQLQVRSQTRARRVAGLVSSRPRSARTPRTPAPVRRRSRSSRASLDRPRSCPC